MKKQDFLFVFILIVIFLPFFVSDAVYGWYKSFNAAHGMVMSFLKFGVLATLGEMLGLRISAGVYNRKGFGVLSRAVVWGILGMGINMAMIVFSKGVPQFMEYMGMADASAIINGDCCLDKLWIALAVSVAMNTIFAPVFMTFHKITDTHILDCGGSLRSLITPIPMARIITHLNWDTQWNFVFKKTIPFFWYPAHTITFLLPDEVRVLFAAILGVRGTAGYCCKDEIMVLYFHTVANAFYCEIKFISPLLPIFVYQCSHINGRGISTLFQFDTLHFSRLPFDRHYP